MGELMFLSTCSGGGNWKKQGIPDGWYESGGRGGRICERLDAVSSSVRIEKFK
jgi:hypothetical protein